ncbi:FAD/NAD(P)-binding protein [Sphingobacterium hungaricum]
MFNHQIAIVGTGPAALYFLHHLSQKDAIIENIILFEKGNRIGCGMPYSKYGAGLEHVTNVSANEIPLLSEKLESWVHELTDPELKKFNMDRNQFNEYKVLPRLFFGNYLEDQFKLVLEALTKKNIRIDLRLKTEVVDIEEQADKRGFLILTNKSETFETERVVICTGHVWPRKNETKIPNYFDSPYPPSKIDLEVNFPVALKGSSLTAVDAIRTLARKNGNFTKLDSGYLTYARHKEKPNFKICMHSRSGLLPDVRIHLDNAQLGLVTSGWDMEFVDESKSRNGGFVSLDEVFDQKFKKQIFEEDPDFYELIKHDTLEGFVKRIMNFRKSIDPFDLLAGEYIQAQKSIERKMGISWKESLAVLSYSLNYPAKYFSAEDVHRMNTHLMPLISIIIAFLPQESTLELLALHQAGALDMIVVDDSSWVEADEAGGATYHYVSESNQKHSQYYSLYIDCTGQSAQSYEEFPFPALRESQTVSPARIKYRNQTYAEMLLENKDPRIEHIQDDQYYLRVPGVAINDYFQAINQYGAVNENLYVMAVPLIAGYNPDYSGLDFCDTAARKIFEKF